MSRESIQDSAEAKEAADKGDHETLMRLAAMAHAQQKQENKWFRKLARVLIAVPVMIFHKVFGGLLSELTTARKSGWLFKHESRFVKVWGMAIVACVLYSCVMIPLALVLPESRFTGSTFIECSLDILFVTDVLIRARTTFRDHGYDISKPREVLLYYV